MTSEIAARETLVQVMTEALLKSGSKKSAVRAVCLGVSGVNHPNDQERILNWLRWVIARCPNKVLNLFQLISNNHL